MKRKVLVVEDEKHIAEGLKINLELEGHDVYLARNGEEGLNLWREISPHLIVLDIMMPVLDGMSVLQEIRKVDQKMPILILSAKNRAQDKVEGLRLGVDDYLEKPFDLDEFLLRVARLLKRGEWSNESEEIEYYEFGPHKLNFEKLEAHAFGKEIKLTEQEFKVLKLFVSEEGKPLTRQKLLMAGWGYSADSFSRTVDNFIVRLRKYFEEDPRDPKYFRSIRSVGYQFDNH